MPKKRKKKRRSSVVINYSSQDWHHFLWQKRHWSKGWAKRLREHPYCGATIPKYTLHRYIHEEIGDIPLPEEKYCKMAFEAIESWLEAGFISIDDPVDKKLETLVKCFNAKNPQTAEKLRKQIKIVARFYEGRP